jgi:hypothetical protein
MKKVTLEIFEDKTSVGIEGCAPVDLVNALNALIGSLVTHSSKDAVKQIVDEIFDNID